MRDSKIGNALSNVKQFLTTNKADEETLSAFSTIEYTYQLFENYLDSITNKQKLTTTLYPDEIDNKAILERLIPHLHDVKWNYIHENDRFYVYPDPLGLKNDKSHEEILEEYGDDYMEPWCYEDGADALYARKKQIEHDFFEYLIENRNKEKAFYLGQEDMEYLKIEVPTREEINKEIRKRKREKQRPEKAELINRQNEQEKEIGEK